MIAWGSSRSTPRTSYGVGKAAGAKPWPDALRSCGASCRRRPGVRAARAGRISSATAPTMLKCFARARLRKELADERECAGLRRLQRRGNWRSMARELPRTAVHCARSAVWVRKKLADFGAAFLEAIAQAGG